MEQQFLPYNYISKLHDCPPNMGYRHKKSHFIKPDTNNAMGSHWSQSFVTYSINISNTIMRCEAYKHN
jgi:hypothetical protein